MSAAARHLARALADMESRMGVAVQDLTADEICRLARACERCADPFRAVNADAAGMPVRVCAGVRFWRLTIGASVWLDDMARLFGAKSERWRMCLVYALVHAREPDAFAGLEDEGAVARAVKACCGGIGATPEEVGRALDEALGTSPRRPARAEEAREAAADWRAVCMRLETQTGIPAREWIWGRSASYALAGYRDLHAFAAAYAGNGTAACRAMRDELDAAAEELQALKVRIMRRVRAARKAGGAEAAGEGRG